MLNKKRNKAFIGVISIFLSHTLLVQAQSPRLNRDSAREHLERAQSYESSGDPRAEQEYRQAIASSNGVYPEAWRWLRSYLSKGLRFEEASVALRTALEQNQRQVYETDQQELRRLNRAAELKGRSVRGDAMSSDEMLELVSLIDQFGKGSDAVPYAEKAVALHPESAQALVKLAFLIKWEQSERAIGLLNQAVAFKPDDPSIYTARGWGYYWCRGDGVLAELDFRKAIELSKGLYASAWRGLGDALAKQGRGKEAIAAFRRYLAIRPNSAAHYDGEIRKSIEVLQTKSLQP